MKPIDSIWEVLASLMILAWVAHQTYRLYQDRSVWKSQPCWSRRLLWTGGLCLVLLRYWVVG